jgi:UDP-N-acetylmuramoylalanine--D-glutamate ligase
MKTLHSNPDEGQILVVGTGATGLSVARYLFRHDRPFALTDTRADPPALAELARFPEAKAAWAGPLSEVDVLAFSRIVLSPGVPSGLPVLAPAIAAGAELIGDIELLARATARPVLGITGSNGKSTVTALTAELLLGLGEPCAPGGNFGTPALDLLESSSGVLVLELSSFQLELTHTLDLNGAVILNLSPDHLDRYRDMDAYLDAKLRILPRAERRILNRSDPTLRPLVAEWSATTFGLDAPPGPEDFGLVEYDGLWWLARGSERLLATEQLALRGRHHWLNALAALALVWPWVSADRSPLLEVLRRFNGLAHRCEFVASHTGVEYINDSKGTNVGATLAAVQSLGRPIVLIAGGQGKDQDFTPLADALPGRVRAVVLLGQDAVRIAAAIAGRVPVEMASSMADAVQKAANVAAPGDAVLLSPACASLDMFRDYADRGRQFVHAVGELQP